MYAGAFDYYSWRPQTLVASGWDHFCRCGAVEGPAARLRWTRDAVQPQRLTPQAGWLHWMDRTAAVSGTLRSPRASDAPIYCRRSRVVDQSTDFKQTSWRAAGNGQSHGHIKAASRLWAHLSGCSTWLLAAQASHAAVKALRQYKA